MQTDSSRQGTSTNSPEQKKSLSACPYKVRGTKVSSPYPIQLTPAETRLVFSLQKHFAPENILVDCYFPKVNFRTRQTFDPKLVNFTLAATKFLPGSEYVQIDCLTINEQGIFVFESKDLSGWIYGSGRQTYWTQTLNYGREKHQFYNPIKQNAIHIDALSELFDSTTPIYSVIVFGRNATLKSLSDLPDHCQVCTQSQLYALLHRLQTTAKTPVLSPLQIATLRTKIRHAQIPPNTILRQEHNSAIANSVTALDQKR